MNRGRPSLKTILLISCLAFGLLACGTADQAARQTPQTVSSATGPAPATQDTTAGPTPLAMDSRRGPTRSTEEAIPSQTQSSVPGLTRSMEGGPVVPPPAGSSARRPLLTLKPLKD